MKIALIVCSIMLLVSCKKEVEPAVIKTDTVVTIAVEKQNVSDNSKNALDWEGIYKGVLPCADCEGIETEVVLKHDLTFVLKTKYLAKGDRKVLEQKGNFVWDKNGSTITLDGLKTRPSQYKVGENKLIQLDMKGNIINGNMAEKYVLTK